MLELWGHAWVVTLLAVLPAIYLWRRSIRRALERKLTISVLRQPGQVPSQLAVEHGRLLSYLELDPDVTGRPPCSRLQLVSLGSYFASLEPHGRVSWEAALVSVADRFGLTAALPLAMFLPPAWRAEGDVGGLLRSFPSLAASSLVTTAVSTLDLAAFGQSVHLYAAGQRRQKAPQQQQQQQQHPDAAERVAVAELRRPGPLDILRGTGGGPDLFGAPPPGDLPSPLLLSRAGALAMLALTEAEAADATPAQAPAPKPLGSKLPDLHLGSGGLALTHSRAGAALCGLAAGVLNRLTANGLAGLAPAASLAPPPGSNPGSSPFAVRLSEGGPLLTSVEQLLAELEEAGHAVDLRLSSNLTSFGVGFSIRCADGGSWQQVPLAYPLRTGLWARDADGREMNVMTLMSHASILLSVKGPQLSFDLEWCLGVSGFTGWLPYAFVKKEWASGEAARISHPLGDMATPGAQRRLLRLLTAASCVMNVAAQRDRLLFGGYGYLGVCLDSAALIQQAVSGTCTLYPLILGGFAKAGLIVAYREAAAGHTAPLWQQQQQREHQGREAAGQPSTPSPLQQVEEEQAPLLVQQKQQFQQQQQPPVWEYAAEAAALQAALADLPCDAIQEPRRAAGAARRALACLPERSVFTAVGRCRAQLQAALIATKELCPARSGAQLA